MHRVRFFQARGFLQFARPISRVRQAGSPASQIQSLVQRETAFLTTVSRTLMLTRIAASMVEQ